MYNIACVLWLLPRIRVTILHCFLLVTDQMEFGRKPEAAVYPSYNRLGYILKELGEKSFSLLHLVSNLCHRSTFEARSVTLDVLSRHHV